MSVVHCNSGSLAHSIFGSICIISWSPFFATDSGSLLTGAFLKVFMCFWTSAKRTACIASVTCKIYFLNELFLVFTNGQGLIYTPKPGILIWISHISCNAPVHQNYHLKQLKCSCWKQASKSSHCSLFFFLRKKKKPQEIIKGKFKGILHSFS